MTTNFFRASAEDFKKIPGSPVAYWMGRGYFELFEKGVSLATIAPTRKGMFTGDNDRYLKLWQEISWCKFGVEFRAYSKGGSFRRWYGNYENVIHWGCSGEIIRQSKGAGNIVEELYFKPCITWSLIASGRPSFRAILSNAFVMGDAGPICSVTPVDMNFLLGYLNTCIVFEIGKLMAPTINCSNGVVGNFPVLDIGRTTIERNVAECIKYSHCDWDRYEGSWDFTVNPLIAAWNSKREKAGDLSVEATSHDLPSDGTLQGIYENVRAGWAANCDEMRRLETENNRIFIEAYGLQDELTPDVLWEEITLTCNPWYRYGVSAPRSEDAAGTMPKDVKLEERLRADTVKELVSYAVGCMMGRYAIDKPGLVLANQGATYEDYLAQISEPAFVPDDDGIIPILEDDCFADDIVTQFHRFLRVTFGDRNFNANLSFIEDALGKDLRSYFVKDFYADHLQRYQKRPIYWLFSSPKGAFSALIYLHRYHPGTVGQVLGYLRSHITKIQSRVDAADRTAADSAATQGMKTRAIKDRAKLVRQLKELEDYERDVLHPLAGQRIEIDLDDGVKANYPKFGKALRKIPGLE